jgi:hypothetical protein
MGPYRTLHYFTICVVFSFNEGTKAKTGVSAIDGAAKKSQMRTQIRVGDRATLRPGI